MSGNEVKERGPAGKTAGVGPREVDGLDGGEQTMVGVCHGLCSEPAEFLGFWESGERKSAS